VGAINKRPRPETLTPLQCFARAYLAKANLTLFLTRRALWISRTSEASERVHAYIFPMGVSSDQTRLAFCLLILQLWTSSDCSVFRAASFGGAQNETFDDVVSLGLSVPTPPFRVSALRVWENDGVMSAFQASYLVYDTTHSGVISLGPRSVTGYSSTAEPTINLVLNAGDLIESASGYSASNSTPELMEFTTLQYIAFVIRRSNGSREEHSAGSLVGQLQSVVGPIVGFWGGVGDTFDQLGVYVDPTLWVDRPTRMLKHELHGRLLGPAGLYFDDVVDLGNPYVLRIRSLSIYVQGGTSVAGIEIMYEDPMGVITVLDHGMILGGSNLNIAVVLNEGDYISQLSVERGQETAEEPAGVAKLLAFNCLPQRFYAVVIPVPCIALQ